MHPFVLLLLVVGTAEESGNRAGLPGLPVAVHEAHGLPVEVVLALHREQRVDPPRCLHPTRFHAPPTIHAQTQKHQQQQQSTSHCCSSNSGPDFKRVSSPRSQFHGFDGDSESQSGVLLMFIMSCSGSRR